MFDLFLGVAIHAKGHFQSRNPGHAIHGLDRAVALLTGEPSFYMALMGEMHEIRDIMDLDPGYRFPVFPIFKQLQDFGFVGRDDFMAADALTDARHAGRWGLVSIDVAMQAFDAVFANVNSMAEINRLHRGSIGIIGRVDPPPDEKKHHRK